MNMGFPFLIHTFHKNVWPENEKLLVERVYSLRSSEWACTNELKVPQELSLFQLFYTFYLFAY